MAHYYYNPETCRYEPKITSSRKFLKNILRFLGISLLIGVSGLLYYNFTHASDDEKTLAEENKVLKKEWQSIQYELKKTSDEVAALENNDDNNFRVILGMEPLSSTQREAGVGGHEKESASIEFPMIRDAVDISGKIKNRLSIEKQSMTKLKDQLVHNERQWASRPAIQPISNKDLIKLYLVYGERMHPLLGYSRPHNGLDFAANFNTPIYATGDGIVTHASGNTTYGNVVFVNHGYGFETRYAHMNKYIVYVGQKIKRGEVLGYVGNTGLSVGPHLHYEVMYQGKFVNPIGFFQLDLKNSEYEKLISFARKDGEPLD